MSHTTLVGPAEVAAHLNDPNWIVCDCRHDLTRYQAGREAYAAAHIPGARFLHLDEDLSGPKTGVNGRHPLPHPMTFALRLGALGIGNNTQVIAYDASGGCFAARLWWMLRWLGHGNVAVLDGGWDGWLAAGGTTTSAVPAPTPVTYSVNINRALSANVAEVAACLKDGTALIVDARSPDRFRGENETLDPVAGHIPGARNRFFKDNLGADGRFKPSTVLREEFSAVAAGVGPERIIHQCGSGVTACHNVLAMEHAGLGGSRLYPGSWSQWVSDRSRPVATGND